MRNRLLLFWWFLTFFLAGLTLLGPRFGLTDSPVGGAGLFLLATLWGGLTVVLLMTRRRRTRSDREAE